MGATGVDLERIRAVVATAIPHLETSHSVEVDFDKRRVVFLRRPQVPTKTTFYVALAPDGRAADETVEVRSMDNGVGKYRFDGPLTEAVAYLKDELDGRLP